MILPVLVDSRTVGTLFVLMSGIGRISFSRPFASWALRGNTTNDVGLVLQQWY
jgi:hypothetical protein